MRVKDLAIALNEDKIKFHKKLNPSLWTGKILKHEVGVKLLQIAEAFLAYIELNEFKIEDIIFTGSMANYNYNEQSDIDLHIIADFDKLPTECPLLAQDFFNAKKKIFNDNHDITIYGYKVELYVEDIKQPAQAGGKYSVLYKKWLKLPTPIDVEVDDVTESEKYQDIITNIENILSSEYNVDEANELLNSLYEMRKEGLSNNGELSFENLVFKALRNKGYLGALRSYIEKNYDESLSLY